MSAAFQLLDAAFGHAAHAFAGIELRNAALTHPVIKAVGIAIGDPDALRLAQLFTLLVADGILL